MGSVEPLFEFMPYGAPEFLQTRRERLAGATLLSSLAIAACFLAAGGVARWIVVPPVRIPLPHFEPHIIEPPPNFDPPRPDAAVPRMRFPDIAGEPVPVPSANAPVEADPVTDGDTGIPGPPATSGEPDQTDVPPGPGVLPGPKDHVWVEELPEPVTRVKPIYPPIAQQAGVEGLVIVLALVGKDGRVLDVRLDEERQVPMLNEVALGAARQWKFTPALANGKPVAVWTAIPFHFRLQ